ncbi:MAG TPA: hypothetical protein DCX60_04255 [Phycisphaerales bacterium]|nr:hypothetical protein [Phycisphaerales bacterium]
MKNRGSNPVAEEGEALENMSKCVSCDYPLQGLAPDGHCPECGKPVRDSRPVGTGTHAEDELIQRAMKYIASGWMVVLLMPFVCLSNIVGIVILLVAVGFRLYGLTRLRSLNRSRDEKLARHSLDGLKVALAVAWTTLGALIVCLIINRVLALLQITRQDSVVFVWIISILLIMTAVEARSWMTWVREEAKRRGFPKLEGIIMVTGTLIMIPIFSVLVIPVANQVQDSWLTLITGIALLLSFPLLSACGWGVTAVFKDMHHQSMDHAQDLGNGDEILSARIENTITMPTPVEDDSEIPLADPRDRERDSD